MNLRKSSCDGTTVWDMLGIALCNSHCVLVSWQRLKDSNDSMLLLQSSLITNCQNVLHAPLEDRQIALFPMEESPKQSRRKLASSLQIKLNLGNESSLIILCLQLVDDASKVVASVNPVDSLLHAPMKVTQEVVFSLTLPPASFTLNSSLT